eukprot:339026_1
MAPFLYRLLTFSICFKAIIGEVGYGTCDQTFHIFKNTMASSDSARECANAYKIFPSIHDEGATKFHDGECAYQCKLELDYTCFKIHAPQTFEHDEGILPIHTFERKMSLKWEYVLNNKYPYDYDSFFDFNVAFWVDSLNDYISHWKSSPELEYFGIEWQLDWDISIDDNEFTENKKFYSLLIHSPLSSINYEFISFHKPKNKFYKHIKWIQSDLPRCTFKAMTPWNRKDNANIVPVRISRATTNINKIYDFYVNILEGKLVNYAISDIAMETDSIMKMTTKTMFILLQSTQIELQFVQRPTYYTTNDFSLEIYENMLLETHATIITSPYCGVDRWFDNHFGYSSFTVPGLMDRIMFKLNSKKIVYKLLKSEYDHSSISAKENLDFYGYDTAYSLSVVEPTGQTLDIGGYINDINVQKFTPVGNPQWCYEPCMLGLKEGHVDPSRVYIDSFANDLDYVSGDNDNKMLTKMVTIKENIENNMKWMHSIAIIVPILIVILLFVHYLYCDDMNNMAWNKYEYSPLIEH